MSSMLGEPQAVFLCLRNFGARSWEKATDFRDGEDVKLCRETFTSER